MGKFRRFYILVANRRTWNASLKGCIWGFSEKTRGFWKTSSRGDLVAFYVTAPSKKIIGFGELKKKFLDESLYWPDEKLSENVIWKYRMKYSIIHVIDNWKKGIPPPKKLILNQGRKIIKKEEFLSLLKEADSKWETNIYKKIFKKL